MIIKCPVCNRKTTWEENPNKPFCSERCRMIDLGKWVAEQYKVPLDDESAQGEGVQGLERDD